MTTSAELTTESFDEVTPNTYRKTLFCTGTVVNSTDFCTTGLDTITYAFAQYYNSATAANFTVSGGKVTFVNAPAGVVYILVSGQGGPITST